MWDTDVTSSGFTSFATAPAPKFTENKKQADGLLSVEVEGAGGTAGRDPRERAGGANGAGKKKLNFVPYLLLLPLVGGWGWRL